jgi:NTP pyrophosphatase (non-canonical NTP hydrolase)
MTDTKATIADMKKAAKEFARERDWEQYHNPKDLSIGLMIEVAELMEHFRFKDNNQISERLVDAARRKEIEAEIGDITHFLVRLADVMKIDLSDAFYEKLKEAANKYPVNKVKGINKKYDEY